MSLLEFKQREPAGCIVETGTPYSELATHAFYPALSEVKIDISRTKAGEGTLTFESRRGPDGEWDLQDSGVFVDWTPVRVSAAFGARAREEIIRGFVREIKAEHPENSGESRFIVTVQDMSLGADRIHRREVWGADTKTSDATILQTVLPRNRLTADPQSGLGVTGIEVNQDGTDAALLRQRAEANGYDLLYRGTTVYFGPLRVDGSPQGEIRVAAGADTNCLSFSANVDGRRPDTAIIEIPDEGSAGPKTLSVSPDLDRMGTTPIESSDLGDHTLVIRGEAGADEQVLRRKTQAKVNELSLKLKAEGELDGTLYGHVLQVGRTVRVGGVGPRFSGIYLVDSVNHRFSSDGYRQQFTLLRNAYGDRGDGLLAVAASGSGGIST